MILGRSLRCPLPPLALASCSEPRDPSLESLADSSHAALGEPRPAAGSGAIHITYEETANYDLLARSLAGSGVFEGMAQAVTSVVALPADLEAVFKECGVANAFYGDGQIVMCYEFFDLFVEIFLGLTEDPQSVQQGVFSTGGFFFLHEIGHALVDQLEIPITGREEDSVDTLAALMMILGGSEVAVWQAVQHFNVMGVAAENEGFRPYWDEHSLDLQRQYDLACLIYGSDPEAWGHMVGPDLLPMERAQRCPTEFWQKNIGWDRLLASHYHSWPLACGLYPFEDEPFVNCARREPDGEIVLRPWVALGSSEPDEIQVLLVDGELLFALASGRTAPALPFDNGADYFVEGLARTVRDGKVGFVNERLELVVPRQWDFAFPFEGGFARVCSGCSTERDDADSHGYLVGGAWGIVDRTGRIVVPVEHDRDSLPAPPPAG